MNTDIERNKFQQKEWECFKDPKTSKDSRITFFILHTDVLPVGAMENEKN